MSATQIAAADINDATQTLEVTWKDGHISQYPLPYLRRECPCANCRSEREEGRNNPFRVIKPSSPASVQIQNIEPVGRYGLRVIWGDGHSTGIYTLAYLREICPCPECSAQRQEEAPYVHGIYIPK